MQVSHLHSNSSASWRGLTTKIHLAADQRCRPIAVVTSEGQRHDSIAFETVLRLVGIDRLGPGRPRTRPDWVLADKAYSSKTNRDYLAKRGIKAAIPVKEDQANGRRRKGSAGGRPPNSTSSATGTATPWNER